VIAGPDELASGRFKLKNLLKRTEEAFGENELAEAAKRELAGEVTVS